MAKLFLFDPGSRWAAPATQLVSDNGLRCAYSGKAIHYLRIGREYWQINEDGDIASADLVRLCV